MTRLQPKTIVVISLVISGLVALVSLIGIYSPDFYSRETTNWQLQSSAQDIIDLVLIVPALMVTSLLTFSNNKAATVLWGGVLLYLAYTFVIYCFDVHFNSLFVIYCLTLGLTGYSFLHFLFSHTQAPSIIVTVSASVLKIIGFYFILVSVLFYLLWLSEIIPALWNTTEPASLVEVGLPTNPVHILDLSFVLPGIFATGILVLRKNPIGITLAPTVLAFFALMDLTIASIIVMMIRGGADESYSVAIIMAVLAVFSLGLLTWYFQSVGPDENN